MANKTDSYFLADFCCYCFLKVIIDDICNKKGKKVVFLSVYKVS